MVKTTVARGPRYARPVRPPLARLFDALADRHRTPVDILCIGDSSTEGTGASARTTRWLDRLQEHLRTAFPVPSVPGGAGYVPAATMSSYASGWTYGGNVETNSTLGLGRRSLVLRGADGFAERTVFGTSVLLAWSTGPSLGSFDVLVDGTVVATVATGTAAGTPIRGGNRRAITFARGAHVVRLRWKSGGDVYLNGLFIRDGDETRGVRVIDSGQHGSTAADWSRIVNPNTARILGDEIAAIQPAAVLIGLGSNDMIQGLTPASHKANLLDVISMARANTTVAADGRPVPILLHAAYQLGANYTYPWSSYVQNMRDIAVADATVELLDFSSRLPRANANADGMIAADGINLNDVGHVYYAHQFRGITIPSDIARFDYAPRQRPVRAVSSNTTAQPDEIIEANAAAGSITIAPWPDLRIGECVTIIKVDTVTSTTVTFTGPMFNTTDAVIDTPGVGAEFTWTGTRFMLTATNVIPTIGPRGEKGERGDAGVKGDKGDKGDRGDAGTSGLSTIRAATDYDNSVAPADQQAVLWVASSGKFTPRSVLTPAQRGAANGVCPLDENSMTPMVNLPVGATANTVARGNHGVPPGGAVNSYLRKTTTNDYDETWETHPASVQASSTTNATAASTTYANIANTGAVFTAPASGRVLVEVSAGLASGATNSGCLMTFVMRQGGTVGSGTVVVAAADANAITNYGVSTIDASRSTLIVGLVPGTVYHVQAMMRSGTTTTATTARQRCIVTALMG